MTMVPPDQVDARLAAYADSGDELAILRVALIRVGREVTMLRDQELAMRAQLERNIEASDRVIEALEERLDTVMRKLSETRGLLLPIVFATSAFWIGILAGWRWIAS